MYIWAVNKNGKIVNINKYRNSNEAKSDGPFNDTDNLGLRLIPVMSDKKQWHFRIHCNRSSSSYGGGGMSMEHYVAQKVFEKRFRESESLWVKYYKNEHSLRPGVKIDLMKYYDTCEMEGSHLGFRADLLLRDTRGIAPPIMIEVWHTHRCDPDKINTGVPIIEFKIKSYDDISRFIRNWGLTESDLRKNQYDVRFFNFRNNKSLSPWPEDGDDDSTYVRFEDRKDK